MTKQAHLQHSKRPEHITGGVALERNGLRRWRWESDGALATQPVRCRKEQWYAARALGSAPRTSADVIVRFLERDQIITVRRLRLSAADALPDPAELLGWIQSPENATHLQVCLRSPAGASGLTTLTLRPVAERDPKCHPLACVPRWSTYVPPFPLERVLLPSSLAALGDELAPLTVEVIKQPRSVTAFAKRVRGVACVLDPAWARSWGVDFATLEKCAQPAWLVVALETFADALQQADYPVRIRRHAATDELMSARVEYADVPTRGFAMQDVFPLSRVEDNGDYAMRVIQANRAWKQFADTHGCAVVLSSETPWENRTRDVVSAMCPVGRGELIATDLPWLVSEARQLTPRLARHALRMHLGAPLDDRWQYWNRWDDEHVVVRDIADLTRRYPALRTARWAPAEGGCARLGLAVADARRELDEHVLICTGRADELELHDGLPPEPFAMLMKMLARDRQDEQPWALRLLAKRALVWQFDTAGGTRFAASYQSAAQLPEASSRRVLRAYADADLPFGVVELAEHDGNAILRCAPGAGVFGNASFQYLDNLLHAIERFVRDG